MRKRGKAVWKRDVWRVKIYCDIGLKDCRISTKVKTIDSEDKQSSSKNYLAKGLLYSPQAFMVSHSQPPYDIPPPALSHRASSVTSRASTTRRHRHARTHHGGSSAYTPQNEFPIFSHTGDVEINITSATGRREQRYLLHRLILTQCSGFFEAGTRAEWSRPAAEDGRSSSQRGQRVAGSLPRIGEDEASSSVGSRSRTSSQEPERRRWRYVLDWGTGEEEEPMLVQKDASPSLFGDGYADRPPPVRNKPPTSNNAFFRSMSNLSALSLNAQPSAQSDPADEVLKDYDNLFRIFYNYHPLLDQVNIATAYTECKALLRIADMYDALEVVGPRIDHHMLRFGAKLFKQIAKYPPSYLKLGYLARSRTIFSESLIHVVGQWPSASPQLKGQIDASVLEVVEDKADEIEELTSKIESKLWRLTLTTSRGERVTPANSFLDWLVMSLFRQWIAENTTPGPTPILRESASRPSTTSRVSSRASTHQHGSNQPRSQAQPPPPAPQPNLGRIYCLLGSTSPAAYLAHDELKRFLKLQPELYTRDNLRRFERRMEEVKNLARDAVQPLMRNFLELDLGSLGPVGLPYLTCTRVEERDLPWEEG